MTVIDPADGKHRDMVWKTGQSRERGPVDEWIGMVCSKVVEVDVQSLVGAKFWADWRCYGVGPLDLNFMRTEAHQAVHSPEMASRADGGAFNLLYMRRGRCRARHKGERLLVEEGHFILLDSALSFELDFPDGTVCEDIYLSEAWLRRWLPHPHAVVAKPVSGLEGWGVPLSGVLRAIDTDGVGDQIVPRPVIADQLGSLIALVFGEAAGLPGSLHTSKLLDRVKHAIGDRYDDETLSPGQIAEELGLSKRYIHKLFARAGTTFGKYLMEVRLARACDMLGDKRYRGYRIIDIASACGFSNPTYFAQQFRTRYKCTPRELRRDLDDIAP